MTFERCGPGGSLAPDLGDDVRRGLVLAGGGLKVAYQAGVLQVWLDEARIAGRPVEFVHADGASGGVFNLAMWCQGMSGRRIADNWRHFSPVTRGATPNLRGTSLFTMRRFRTNILEGAWGLDWDVIRRRGARATFNVFDVDAQRLRVLPPAEMSEDMLVAATSLPGWYPPVVTGGRRYIDAVFTTDANLAAAIDGGANELWIPWTVSMAGRWRSDPVSQYFQVIEAAANGRLHADLDRIAASNEAWARKEQGEFPYPVRVVPLVAEVPIHYLFVFTRRAVARAVELGVGDARRWCRDRGIELGPVAPPVPPRDGGVRFRERMSGPVRIGNGATDRMTLALTATVPDAATFADGDRVVDLAGHVDCPGLGGRMPVTRGTLTLLPGDGPSTMDYRLDFADGTGRLLSLVGTKTVRHDAPFDLWPDTSTLAVEVSVAGTDDPPVVTGTLRLRPRSFLRLLTTMRGTGADAGGRLRSLWSFGSFFAGRLGDIYLPPPDAPLSYPSGHEPRGAAVVTDNAAVVPASPDRVWELLVDAPGWPRFYGNARRIRLDDGAARIAEGTSFRWITFATPIRSTAVLYEPGVELGWTWTGPLSRGYHGWRLEEVADGTLVRTIETQRGPLPWLLRSVLRRVVSVGHDAWLRGLAEQASTGQG
ncbi:MAG: hypothetical protein ABS81_11325 [Pseudonocardia sp. SCN 72-86]|nr:MAG: hypothetical protein ABS81_11325 [Pseudonocardia sp. SCN 72-86]